MIINQQKNADYEHDNVKDKNNILNYNLWSMGDYSNTLGFNNNGGTGLTVVRNNEWAVNGSYSAKATFPTDGYIRYKMDDAYSLAGKQVSFKANVKNNSSVRLDLFEYYENNFHIHSTLIPGNSNNLFSVTVKLNEDTSKLLLSINSTGLNVVYTDNWQLIV